MAKVTIVGSASPSTYLARGEQRTVERTELVDKLLTKGYVEIVEEPKKRRGRADDSAADTAAADG
jgi:hypothetical protein